MEPPGGGVLTNYLRRARDPMSDVRGVRAFKVIVDPCHIRPRRGCTHGNRRPSLRPTTRGSASGEGADEAGLRSGRSPPAQPYHTRSESVAAKIGRGPNLTAKAPEYAGKVRRTVATSRPTRSKTAPPSTISPASGGIDAHRADRSRRDLQPPLPGTLCLTSVADNRAPDSICIADDGSGPETGPSTPSGRASRAPLRHVLLALGSGLREGGDPQQGHRDVGGRLPDLIDGDVLTTHLHRPPPRPRRARPLLDRQPDPPRAAARRRHPGDGRRRTSSTAAGSGEPGDRSFGTWLETMPMPAVRPGLPRPRAPVQRALCAPTRRCSARTRSTSTASTRRSSTRG